LLHEVVHETLHLDGTFATSVGVLVTRPGFLTLEHFAGRRARYVPPLRLYLIFSVLYFALAIFAPDFGLRITPGRHPDFSPEAVQRRGEMQKEVNEALSHWAPRLMFVLVPLFAGVVAAATARSGRNYPQDIYFSLHVHAAWFLGGAVSTAARLAAIPGLSAAVSSIVTIYGAWYFVTALRRVYGTTWIGALLRAAFVFVLYLGIVLVVLIAIAWAVNPELARRQTSG
jgi:hypothetical protein